MKFVLKLVEPILYIIGFVLAAKLIVRLKYAPAILLGLVAKDISFMERLYLIGIILVWILLAGFAVLILKNATRIGISLTQKVPK